jgi:hypothetical protein
VAALLPMRVRWIVASASVNLASTRIRVLSVIRGLRNLGIDAALFEGAEAPCQVAVFGKAYGDREIELSMRLRARGTVIVFDLCDNHFMLEEATVRRLRAMMEAADVWTFSTDAMRAVAQRQMGMMRPSHVIPDPLDLDQQQWETSTVRGWWHSRRFQSWKSKNEIRSQPIDRRLLWFGNHAGSVADSGMNQLNMIGSHLARWAEIFGATLTVVSNSRSAYQALRGAWNIPSLYHPWNVSTFQDVLRMHSIVLLPFSTNEFNIVKSNNRLLVALHNGAAVVANAIPSYREFADCTVLDDWTGVDRYLADESLRQRHVSAGRERVLENYMPKRVNARWASLFAEIAG